MTDTSWIGRAISRRSVRKEGALPVVWAPSMRSTFREADTGDVERFVANGYKRRQFFPHRVYALRKCGPDGHTLARLMRGIRNPSQLWQILLYATHPAIDEFPSELFFDADLNWHQQHCNRPGQIASATLMVSGRSVSSAVHQSDLVQRISRNRAFKSRVDRLFGGWHRLLLNGIVGFAADHGFERVYVPTSELAMRYTDRTRSVQPELFERVYDRAPLRHFNATRDGRWWRIDAVKHRDAIVALHERHERIENNRVLCVTHDTERGLGHLDVEPDFARQADQDSPAALDGMLEIERRLGIRATYHVVGRLLPELRNFIERDAHCLAFHSYDHDLARPQLTACRTVDYRLKGYRVPQSRITEDLQDTALCAHNFEWLASANWSLGVDTPTLTNRIVKIPISFDDFVLHTRKRTFDEWAQNAIRMVERQSVTAFSLHDCYASHWLPHYERFLTDIGKLGRFRTMDEVAGDLSIASAV